METNVYFISGITANCQVFEHLELPKGFNKVYIEWIIPDIEDTLQDYARKMAESIDRTQPYVLLGYSFGGIIIQEMNYFLKPEKNIIVASVKSEDEFPPLLRFGRRIKFAKRFPLWSLSDSKTIKDFLARYIYQARDIDMFKYVSYTDPTYMKWSIHHILNWTPQFVCPNLYHIHGTRDITFPQKYIKEAIFINRGDHLMVMKRPQQVNEILAEILIG